MRSARTAASTRLGAARSARRGWPAPGAARAQERRCAYGERLLGGDIPEILRSQTGEEQQARIVARLRKSNRAVQELRAASGVGFQHAAHSGEQGRREFVVPVGLQKGR